MEWLYKHNGTIIVSRRQEYGAYRLYIDVTIGEKIWQWAVLIVPEKIKNLQNYIMQGVKVFRKIDV